MDAAIRVEPIAHRIDIVLFSHSYLQWESGESLSSKRGPNAITPSQRRLSVIQDRLQRAAVSSLRSTLWFAGLFVLVASHLRGVANERHCKENCSAGIWNYRSQRRLKAALHRR